MSEKGPGNKRSKEPEQFATTQWSLVLAAGRGNGAGHQGALSELCQKYWYPLYVYVRRRVQDVHDAQDLTQSFLAQLLDKDLIRKADSSRGRFRAFLLTALKNFLASHWQKRAAIKRGGGRIPLSLDFESGEKRFQMEPFHSRTPEDDFERKWVLTLLDQALDTVKAELSSKGRLVQFEQLKGAMTGELQAAEYLSASRVLGISPEATKQAAYRLRKRYREIFRETVAQTVENPADLEDEIDSLLQTLEKN